MARYSNDYSRQSLDSSYHGVNRIFTPYIMLSSFIYFRKLCGVSGPKPDAVKDAKPEEDKAEAPKPEEAKAEAPKPEEAKAEAPKPGEVKAEAPKVGEAKAEAPKL